MHFFQLLMITYVHVTLATVTVVRVLTSTAKLLTADICSVHAQFQINAM